MSRIYTRSGDAGQSGLFNGQRLPKTASIFAAIGDVDELNSLLGVIRSHTLPEIAESQLKKIQNRLFDLGSNLAGYQENAIDTDDADTLESWIDEMQSDLEPLKQFILPAGGPVSSFTHLARSVCRRAERHVIEAAVEHLFPSACAVYLNRLSDYLFVLARYISRGKEQFWEVHA
ncbi:cob(I)yrinic acid a,c-diamide adenosyltransferase [Marinicella sp. W31]|uniref:cob(I)yrinic acid a,c-diamide adenosyltransferase n=1 Tax=Marinicella sp. W31 TaxID=3023713 RepID=UPI0037581F08